MLRENKAVKAKENTKANIILLANPNCLFL